MLTQLVSSLPFIGLTYASLSQMAKTEEKLIAEVNRKAERDNNQAGLRSFNSVWAQAIISGIDGYGCWCYFQDAHGSGKGAPVNKVDEQCKILHDGYSCILMDDEDAGEDGENCVPWDVKYNWTRW